MMSFTALRRFSLLLRNPTAVISNALKNSYPKLHRGLWLLLTCKETAFGS